MDSYQVTPWEIVHSTQQFTYVGIQCISLLGFPNNKWYEKDFWINVLHPEDRKVVLAFYRSPINIIMGRGIEFRLIDINNQVVWIRSTINTTNSAIDDGRLRGFIVNISTQKKQETTNKNKHDTAIKEMLQYQSELKQLIDKRTQQLHDQARIIDQIHDAVITINVNNRITSWNTGAETLFGYSANEMINQPISQLFPTQNNQLFDNSLMTALRKMKDIEMESSMRKKDASSFYSLLSLSILTDISNIPKGVICSVLDISDRKFAEESLLEYSAELNAVNKELKTFCYSVSHDLRTPLRSIAGFSHALIEDYGHLLDKRAINYINRIENAAQHMGDLIHSLLNLSRVTRKKLNFEPINLNHLVNDIIHRHNLPPDIFHCRGKLNTPGDRALLTIALENLISNAVKYSQHVTKPKIEIGKIHKNGNNVFFVRDNGVGFDKAYSQQMFAPFRRLHSKTSFDGAGIGLAIVQRVINKHHGKIWAESEEHKGATFYFTISHNQARKSLSTEPI